MRYPLLLLLTFLFINCRPFINQSIGQNIEDYVAEVNLDSLIKTVRILSGEDSAYVNGIKILISKRVNSSGNDLAADFIKEKLSSYGLLVEDQVYSQSGRNILATQIGSKHPDSIYILCAHYDAVANYCADDNASGTSAVIEAARVLTKECFEFTIIYALWDEEEIGKLGSAFYANQAAKNSVNILGVVNLDMIGYDGDDDGKFDVHTKNSIGSILLKDSLISVVDNYGLNLSPNIINPGTKLSDHASFWNSGYGAIFFGEAFFGGDRNPFYHTRNDRINRFNLPYFQELSRLSIGMISTMARPCIITEIEETAIDWVADVRVYPNPTTDILYIDNQFDTRKIEISDIHGRRIASKFPDKKLISIDLSGFSNGIYIVKIEGNKMIIEKVVKR